MTWRWTLAWRSRVKLTNGTLWQAMSRRGTLWASSIVTIAVASWMTLSMNQKESTLRNLHAEWKSSRSTEEFGNNAPVNTVFPGCGKSSNFIADAAESVMPSVVNLRLESQYMTENGHKLYSSGSGVVIDTEGTILTNAHVVTDISDSGTVGITILQLYPNTHQK